MKTIYFLTGAIATVLTISNAAYATRSTQPQAANPTQSRFRDGVQVAGLFRILDVAEDIDDLAKGNIRGIDPIKEVTRDVEDALDDTRDSVKDFGDDVGDSVRDFNRAVDRAADDVEDWFD